MANVLSPLLKQQFIGPTGAPIAFGLLSSFAAGTTTPLGTFNASGGANANPVILDASGRADVWVPPNVAYKFNLTDSAGNQIPGFPIDNVVSSQLITLYGGVDTGVANAYVLTFTANFNAYTDGIIIYWIPAHSNTTGSTINVNGLGVVNITNQDGSALSANQIIANQVIGILFKGGAFLLLNVSAATLAPSVNIQNNNYTFQAADANNVVIHTDSNAWTYSIAPDSTTNFPVGTSIEVVNQSSAVLTVQPGGAPPSLFAFGGGAPVSTSVQLSASTSCFFLKTAANTWQQSTLTQVPWQLSSFTGTITGVTATIQGAISYRQTGHLVTLYLLSSLTGISNSTGLGLTGLPTSIRPGAAQVVSSLNMEDNGATVGGVASIATGGTVTFGSGINGDASGFTSSGTKGLKAGWSITYCVN